jgi:hypothetical protein
MFFITFISFSFLARKRERNEPKKEKTRFRLPAACSSKLSLNNDSADELIHLLKDFVRIKVGWDCHPTNVNC